MALLDALVTIATSTDDMVCLETAPVVRGMGDEPLKIGSLSIPGQYRPPEVGHGVGAAEPMAE